MSPIAHAAIRSLPDDRPGGDCNRASTLTRLLIATAVVFLPTQPAHAEPAGGRKLYLQYCSACHGSEGKGDGVVAGLMRPHPADLTGLARRNKGTFPTVQVIDIIDGRTTLRAHGDPDMPVWGTILQADVQGAHNPDQAVYSVVAQITDYLRTIQAR